MREQFEKLPEIANRLKGGKYIYCERYNSYIDVTSWDVDNKRFVNGAWYAFQEQQKKIQAAIDLLNTPMNGTVSDLLRDLEDVLG